MVIAHVAILLLVSLAHNDVVTVLFLLLALTFAPQPPRCKPQLAPLETGTSSGASDSAFWRKEEAGDWRGTGWLGWTWDGYALKPVTMMVRDRPKDLPGLSDDDVYVQSIPNVTFAVRCVSGLRAGKIQSAGVVNHNLQYSGPLDVSLGKLRYQVRVEAKDPAAADAKVILAHAGRTQVLASVPAAPVNQSNGLGARGRSGDLRNGQLKDSENGRRRRLRGCEA